MWKRSCAAMRPSEAIISTASAASSSTFGSTCRSVEEKGFSTKSAASWRPGGRPMPMRTRVKSPVPAEEMMSRIPLWPP